MDWGALANAETAPLPVQVRNTGPLSARVEAPKVTARLSVPQQSARSQPVRTTTALKINPPSLGKYLYWNERTTGFRLDYRKRNMLSPTGFDYLYLGWWSKTDLLALFLELSPEDLMRVLRSEANRNAKRYLERKAERDAART